MTAQIRLEGGLEAAWTAVATFVPKLVAFLLILALGLVVAKVVQVAIVRLLERFRIDDRLAKGSVGRALMGSNYRPVHLLGQIVFATVALFVLQLAFGVFGENPVSDLLASTIAFLPRLLVALVIVVVASAIAGAVRDIVASALAPLSYGGALAMAASASIVAIGVFAALDHLEIAPAIVTGLFYALLAIVAGSAIVAIGGGGIRPMQQRWEQALARIDREAPKVRDEAAAEAERRRQDRVDRVDLVAAEESESVAPGRPAEVHVGPSTRHEFRSPTQEGDATRTQEFGPGRTPPPL